jgi:hypothetical protein
MQTSSFRIFRLKLQLCGQSPSQQNLFYDCEGLAKHTIELGSSSVILLIDQICAFMV